VIEGNTVANNAHQGIRLNAFINTTVRNNVVYNNQNQIVVEDKKGPSRHNVIEGNTLFVLSPEQMGLKLTNLTNHGKIDNNMYCNPFFGITLQRNVKNYSLGFWQQEFSTLAQKSKVCKNPPKLAEYIVSEVSNNLMSNATFDTDVKHWKGSGSADIFYDTTQAQMDGGSLKAVYRGTKNANVIPNSFILNTGQLYHLKFSIVGHGFGTLKLRINNMALNKQAILKESLVAYDQTRKDYEIFFQAPVTTDVAKILFITTQDDANPYWLDNVSFAPIKATLNDLKQKAPLFINPTANPNTIDLGSAVYQDLEGKTVTGSLTLSSFSSQILMVRDTESVITKKVPDTPKVPPAPRAFEFGKNLVSNSTFDTDVNYWKGSGASTISHDTTQAHLDGGSLKAVYSGTKNANVIPNSFILTTGQSYYLKFSVVGNGPGTIKLRINNTNPNHRAILKESIVAYDKTRKDYEMSFQSPVTTDVGKILFITTQDDAETYWLDNVSFAPIKELISP